MNGTDKTGVTTVDLVEALESPRGRGDFLKSLGVGGAAIVGAAVLNGAPIAAMAAGPTRVPASDIAILNYALTLEHLEADFYATAIKLVPFEQTSVRELAHTLRHDENTHVAALTAAIRQLGGTPVAAARVYDFGTLTFTTQSGFLKLAEALEDTGVHAYLGAAGLIKTPSILLTAASILTVEARHAGAIRYQFGLPPTVAPFDTGLSMQQVLAIAGPFIKTM